MIIELLLSAIFNIFKIMTALINIPSLPDNVQNIINEGFNYISSGVGIIANYTDIGYLLVLFSVIIGIDVGVAIYHFVMWVIRKIPMLSMS